MAERKRPTAYLCLQQFQVDAVSLLSASGIIGRLRQFHTNAYDPGSTLKQIYLEHSGSREVRTNSRLLSLLEMNGLSRFILQSFLHW